MCDLNCANLIDLSLEDNSPQKTENVSNPSESFSQGHFVSPPRKQRDSLDNNPFDCVQKLANRQDDPFDIVEKEACFKARHCAKPPTEVKLGNLLSLDDDNLMENDCVDRGKIKFRDFDLDSESPPVTMADKMLPDSSSGPDTDSNANSSAESSASAKLKKTMEYRKRLLKLSLTNAAFNSPVSRRASLEEVDSLGTPVSSALSRSPYFGEHLLASESPLKFVDDDIMSEEPPSLLTDEKNFEADLEMLRIPMLSELQSPHQEHFPITEEQINACPNDEENTLSKVTAILDLEAIKARLKAKREETNNNHQDINSLMYDLKSLINSGEMVANGKQMQASTLLESLSSALTSSQNAENAHNSPDDVVLPQPIKRQGTFDMDLRENHDQDLATKPFVNEMPNCMTSSSATYDGEAAEDKQELNLPEIDPPSPQSPECETTLQPDVNDIMEQLTKLLIHNNSAEGNQNGQQNPTFIVVMNTNPMPQNSSISSLAPAAKHRSAMISSYMENSFNDGSPDLNKSNTTTRRRSQSLSLHDKVKIVKIPRQPPTPKRLQKQQTTAVDESTSVTTTPPPNDLDTPEFKTPGRMVRRNSYSSGTPYTTTVGLRRTGFSSDGKTTTSHVRMTQTLDTHHEGHQQQKQQKAIVRPMSMPSNNLSSFKPDLKKKHKPNTESIMKSSGPLKATIPVKKVAPMLKISSPTADIGATDVSHNTSQYKTNRIPTTPLASGRSSTIGVPVGYPNACSTPSAFTSPMKRSVAHIPKPRYSYLSVTPNSKPTAASSGTASLKRRTITEFKVKSPLKSRLSTTGLTAASTSRSTVASSRLSTSSSAKLPSKTPAKLGANTATVRPTGRMSSRNSSVGANLSTRNKENKHP